MFKTLRNDYKRYRTQNRSRYNTGTRNYLSLDAPMSYIVPVFAVVCVGPIITSLLTNGA